MTINAREGSISARLLTAVVALVLTVAAPVAIDLSADNGPVSLQAAAAKGGNGGGNGGGNAGGNNAGGNGKGKGKGKGPNGAPSTESDSTELILLIPRPGIEMAVITTEIRKRYPADEIASLDNPHKAVSFFTEIRDMSGTTVTHRWFYEGDVQFEATFNVMSNKWRVWSTQLLPRDKPGQWTLQVLDQGGKILEARKLNYQPGPDEMIAGKS